jgi:hypothetical protein
LGKKIPAKIDTTWPKPARRAALRVRVRCADRPLRVRGRRKSPNSAKLRSNFAK